MSRRLELHEILVTIMGTQNLPTEDQRVYFQPPSSVKMKYPAIVYRRSRNSPIFADDIVYQNREGYLVTLIDPNPDSLIPDQIAALPYSRFDRHFTADNLNHDVYIIYH